MPDLNLIDEGGFDEAPVPVAPPAKKKISKSGGGGGLKILALIMILILVVGGVVYYLNQRGTIKLWGKKKTTLAQLQDEPFQQEPMEQGTPEQAAPEQAAEPQQQPDTSEVALLETAPVEEKVEPQKETKAQEEVTEPESVSKLSEMKGEFTVQVIAYREKSKAVETSKNLEYAGYPSFVEKVPMKGGDWYTVRIGKYPTREDAQKAVKNFAAQLQTHYVIDKIRNK
jgi:septal ring-binding cell division protein DamX